RPARSTASTCPPSPCRRWRRAAAVRGGPGPPGAWAPRPTAGRCSRPAPGASAPLRRRATGRIRSSGRTDEVGGELRGPLAQGAELVQLAVELAQALVARGLVLLHGALRRVQRLVDRALELLGPGGERVAQVPLDVAQRVARVLRHEERQVVD